MNPKFLLLTSFIIFLIILYFIIKLFLDDTNNSDNIRVTEKFEVDNNNYYELVDCENYPYLCKLEKQHDYSDYLYNRALPKQKLIQTEKLYKRQQKRNEKKSLNI